MKVPKIIYHGTTALRWHFIKKEGLLKRNKKTGYLYLTANLDEVVVYGLQKSISDMCLFDLENDKIKAITPNYKDVVVIGIDMSKLEDRLEIDPECITPNLRSDLAVRWYRYKGDVKLEDLYECHYRAFDSFSSNIMNKMTKRIKQTHELISIYRENSLVPFVDKFYGGSALRFFL